MVVVLQPQRLMCVALLRRLAASEHCDVVCAPRAAGEHENGSDVRPSLEMKALGLSYRVMALPGGSTGPRRAPARKSKSRESSRAAAQTASPEALLARHGCVRTYGEVKGQGELENPSQNASKKKHTHTRARAHNDRPRAIHIHSSRAIHAKRLEKERRRRSKSLHF
jgi:hypothetical protein